MRNMLSRNLGRVLTRWIPQSRRMYCMLGDVAVTTGKSRFPTNKLASALSKHLQDELGSLSIINAKLKSKPDRDIVQQIFASTQLKHLDFFIDPTKLLGLDTRELLLCEHDLLVGTMHAKQTNMLDCVVGKARAMNRPHQSAVGLIITVSNFDQVARRDSWRDFGVFWPQLLMQTHIHDHDGLGSLRALVVADKYLQKRPKKAAIIVHACSGSLLWGRFLHDTVDQAKFAKETIQPHKLSLLATTGDSASAALIVGPRCIYPRNAFGRTFVMQFVDHAFINNAGDHSIDRIVMGRRMLDSLCARNGIQRKQVEHHFPVPMVESELSAYAEMAEIDRDRVALSWQLFLNNGAQAAGTALFMMQCFQDRLRKGYYKHGQYGLIVSWGNGLTQCPSLGAALVRFVEP